MANAKIVIDDNVYEVPVIEGTEGELGIDVTKLRDQTGGVITYDPGYMSTGSCKSAITYVDGEKGILRYRGYAIEDLAVKAKFPCVAYLLINERLPNERELNEWRRKLTINSFIHEDMLKFFDGFPPISHPMTILSSMVASLGAYFAETGKRDDIDLNIIRLLAQAKTIMAFAYKKSIGQPRVYPRAEYSYTANFLRMMFATPVEEYVITPVLEQALDLLLIVHADHEQNCSTSTVRMVGSSRANLFESISAGISALSGPLHGGANQAVIEMLERIMRDGGDVKGLVERVKVKRNKIRLMGFGHRVYKAYDPRARLLKTVMDRVVDELGAEDPLVDLAKRLEQAALEDEYFIERNLYPNVDFYSGILYRAMGIPTNMFTAMFALGRMPGWIAHWKEMRRSPANRIHRPRQIYTGPNERQFIPIPDRPDPGGA